MLPSLMLPFPPSTPCRLSESSLSHLPTIADLPQQPLTEAAKYTTNPDNVVRENIAAHIRREIRWLARTPKA